MTLAKALRLLLGLFAALVVAWAFVDVTSRMWRGATAAGKVELTVMHWGDNEEIEIIEAMLAEFRAQHPEIAVHRVHAPDYWPKVKTMFASGDPPDLFYLEPQYVPELVDLELIRPIDDLIEKAGGEEAVLGDYYDVPLGAFRYDGETLGLGQLYGIPKDFSTAVMYVNLDLFEQAGVEVPYDGWTWAEYESAMRKITDLSTPQRKVWGGMLQLWPATILNIIWTYDGDFFAVDEDGRADFSDVTLDQPEAQAALEMIQRVRLKDRTVYNTAGIAEEADSVFVRGDMGTLGPIGRWRTPLFRKAAQENGLRFDVVPVPHAPGVPPASQIFTTAYAMSASTEHPEEAFLLQRFLTGPIGARISSEKGLAIPPMKSVARSPAFLTPGVPPLHDEIFLEAIEYARLQQFPLDYARFDQIVKDAQQSALELGNLTPEQAAAQIEREWLALINSPLRTDDFARVNWWVVGSIAGVFLAVAATLIWIRSSREKLGDLDRSQQRAGYAFIAPWLIGFAVLTIFPMVLSLLLAFTKWTAMTPLARAEFVGLANFSVLARDSSFWQSIRVTAYYVLLGVPLTQVLALGVALLMNARARGIGIFRTIYFVPSVVSGVALATLWLKLFNRDYGLINALLSPIKYIGLTPPDWFGADAHWAAVPAFVLMGLWGIGGGMVIYLAGLKNIPASLYEAATIDGAGPWGRLWNVTIPTLSPLIFFNVVMGLIASFQIFTQAKVMTDGGPDGATLFYVLNLYRSAFQFHQMGYASAMAWVLFLLILLLTLVVFRGSRGMVHYEGLKG